MQSDWQALLGRDTSPSSSERLDDVWDNDNACNYSADGTLLLDAESYPDVVHVREGR